jgi:hypothetical protein
MKKSHLAKIKVCLVAFLIVCLFATLLLYKWNKGKDRSVCIINIRNAQQAMRGYVGMNQGYDFSFYTPEKMREIIFTGPDAYLRYPVCPSGGTYTLHDLPAINPPLGFVFLTCSCAKTLNHKPDNTADW